MSGEKPKQIVVPLKHPVTVQIEGDSGPREFKELSVRRMKAKDAYVAEREGEKVRAGYLMFAALADVPLVVIEELDMEDIASVGEAVATMMGKRLSDLMKTAGGEQTGAASADTGATLSPA